MVSTLFSILILAFLRRHTGAYDEGDAETTPRAQIFCMRSEDLTLLV